MATRLTIESSRYGSAFVIAEDSEPEMDDPFSSAFFFNITQYKKVIQYVDQVQFDNMQEIIKQFASVVSRMANNNSISISILHSIVETSLFFVLV